MEFPIAEETINDLLRAAQEPGALVHLKLGDRPWTYMKGSDFKAMLDGELPDTLTVDYVIAPA